MERQQSLGATSSVMELTVSDGNFYGRGGAGNLRNSSTEASADAERRAREAQNKAYEKTVKDVEKGLQQPARAHLVNEKLL